MIKGKKKKIVNIPKEYMDSIIISESIFSSLFQFENGLRIVIDKYLSAIYGSDWWESSLKNRKFDIYEYADNIKKRMAYMPWIGSSTVIQPLPIHSITLGQLEEIIKAYKSECIPILFPSLDFICGRLELIKRVRNLFAHMYPCIGKADVRVAKRDILTLSEHLNYILKSKPERLLLNIKKNQTPPATPSAP